MLVFHIEFTLVYYDAYYFGDEKMYMPLFRVPFQTIKEFVYQSKIFPFSLYLYLKSTALLTLSVSNITVVDLNSSLDTRIYHPHTRVGWNTAAVRSTTVTTAAATTQQTADKKKGWGL